MQIIELGADAATGLKKFVEINGFAVDFNSKTIQINYKEYQETPNGAKCFEKSDYIYLKDVPKSTNIGLQGEAEVKEALHFTNAVKNISAESAILYLSTFVKEKYSE